MIVTGSKDKITYLVQKFSGTPVVVPTDNGLEQSIVVVDPSKSNPEKCMVGIQNPQTNAYHKFQNTLPCACYYINLVKTILLHYPSGLTIVCAGVTCNTPGWENSIAKLIPCDGLKKDAYNQAVKKLEAIGQKYGSGGSLLGVATGLKKKPVAKKTITYDQEEVSFPGEYAPVLGELENIPIVGKGNIVRSVHGAVYNFYALEEASLSDNLPSCFNERYKEFLESTARTMFDYLATICMSEARHAYYTTWNVYGVNNENKSRHNAWTLGRHYNPRQSLKVCEYIFPRASFPGGYGGKNWENIAKCAGRYFTLPVKSWFDHVVDLAHNGGLAFNKGVFWYNPANPNHYISMLNRRKKGSIFDDGKDSGYGSQNFVSTHGEQKWLLYCGGLIDTPGPKIPPLKWGDKLVVVQLGVANAGGDIEEDETESPPNAMLPVTRLI